MKNILKKLAFTVLFTVIVMLSLSFNTFADEESNIIASGVFDSVNWSVNDEGLLRIYGQQVYDRTYSSDYPWYEYRDSVKKVVIEDGVLALGRYAFLGYTNLTDVVIGNGMTELPDSGFANCTSLANIKLPESLKSTSINAFSNCESLKRIDIPDHVSHIGSGTFDGCSSLEIVNVSDISVWCNIEFKSTPFINGADLYVDGELVTSVVVPEGVEVLQGCFEYYQNLKEITLPSTLFGITSYTFYNCTSLEKVEFNDGLYYISDGAFKNCYSLKDVVFPDSLVQLSQRAFHDCTSIESIVIPPLVYELGSQVFEGCTSLKEVTLPEELTIISGGAFNSCTSLKYIEIPENCTYIGKQAFGGCSSLETVVMKSSYMDYIGDYAFNDCFLIKEFTVPAGVTEINEGVFRNCEMIEKIMLPSTVTKLGRYAFLCCYKLKDVEIPSGVTFIGEQCFYYCSSVEELHIPEPVEIIGRETFYNCTSLKKITIPNSVKTIEYQAFYNCQSVKELVLPRDLISLGGECFVFMSSLESIVIPESITDIPNNMLYGCTSLKSVVLPKRVNSFGRAVFGACSSLETVKLPENLTSIPEYTFSGCKALVEIIIPETVKSIGNSAFEECNSLKEVKLPEGVNYIGSYAFFYCFDLERINIPKGVTEILTYTFGSCYSLESIEIPHGVTSIGDWAFVCCAKIEKIRVPDSVTSIGMYAFDRCESLIELVLSKNLKSVGERFFDSCYNLERIVIPASITDYTEYSFTTSYYDTYCIYVNNQDIVSSIDSFTAAGGVMKFIIAIPTSFTSIGSYITENYVLFDTVNYYGVEYNVYREDACPQHEWTFFSAHSYYTSDEYDCCSIYTCRNCKLGKDFVSEKHSFENGVCTLCFKEKLGFINDEDGFRYYYKDGSYAKGWTLIEGKAYRFDGQGILFEGTSLTIGSSTYYFDNNHALLEGLVLDADGYRFYKGGVRQYGWADVDGDGEKDSYFYVSTMLRCEEDRVLFDGVDARRFFIYNNETGYMELANGFYTDEKGTQFFRDGLGAYGWITADGVSITDKPGITLSGVHYFAYGDGINFYMVENETKTIGGVVREFDENHLVKAYTGWAVNKTTGNDNYYIEGVLQQGWCQTPEGWVYLSRSENLANNITYGDVFYGWRKIGGKVYYFRASTSVPRYTVISDPARELTYNGVRKTYYTNQTPENMVELVGSDFYIINYPSDL